MQDYLTKPKTILKKEENAHIFHQQLPQQKTEYSPGNSAETIKTRGKQETIHSPTNATNHHIHFANFQKYIFISKSLVDNVPTSDYVIQFMSVKFSNIELLFSYDVPPPFSKILWIFVNMFVTKQTFAYVRNFN